MVIERIKTENKISQVDFIVTATLFFIAYLIRTNTFIDMDVAWHIEGAKRFISGDNYLTNIFDDNSPFVFWFYTPVIILKALTSWSYRFLIPAYVLTSNLITLILFSNVLHRTRFSLFAKHLLYYLVIAILLFLPLMNFGQREVILMNFLLPYFLLLLNVTNRYVSKTLIVICTLLASFGIMQNPLYLLVTVAVDVTRWIYHRRFEYFQIIFYASTCLYFLIIHYFYPEYFTVILPFVVCYESAFNSSWFYLLTGATLLTILIIALVLINLKKFITHGNIMICIIATILSLLIYFLEKKDWYNHLYPAFSFALLTNALLLVLSLESDLKKRIAVFYQTTTTAIFIITLVATLNFLVGMIREFHDNNYIWNKWISFSNQHFQHKKVFFLMSYYPPLHQLPIYSNVNVVSPWFNTWFIPALEKNRSLPSFCNLKNDLQIISNLITNSINRSKPDFILVRPYTVPDNLSFPASGYFLRNYYLFSNYQGIAIYKKRG